MRTLLRFLRLLFFHVPLVGLSLFPFLSFAWPASGGLDTTGQRPLDPVASRSLTEVPDGFSLTLFASEPDIGKPIAMNWDERGRLWIIETVDFPNSVTAQSDSGDDRILICEDRDGDGRADNFTVFADGLNVPTSFTFVEGGVLVAQAPHFLLLKDLDGDDVADSREIVMTGWGTFDAHAGPSNLQYGLDNKVWGTVGHSGFDGYIEDHPAKFKQGVFRFDSDASRGVKDFEYLASTSNNTWGLGYSEEFDVFLSCTNNEHSIFFAIPAAYYAKAGIEEQGVEPINSHYAIHPLVDTLNQKDVVGGFTAATGHSLYTARSFPRQYWNRVAFICEPTGRLVHKHIITRRGSGFAEVGDGKNILASRDTWFSPVAAKVGPDGALWVLDWYNHMVHHLPEQDDQHGQDRRDLFRGRVYRLVYDEAPATQMPALSVDRPETLVQAIQHDNMFWRTTAQRLVVERNYRETAPALRQLISVNTTDKIQTNGAALHAVWTLKGLGLITPHDPQSLQAVVRALRHAAPGVRKAAVQTLPIALPAVLDSMVAAGVFYDDDDRVRLAAYLALADAPTSFQVNRILEEAMADQRNIDDKWIAEALKIGGRIHGSVNMEGRKDADIIRPTPDQHIEIRSIRGGLSYDRTYFSVRANSRVRIKFSNPNFMQHNLVIIKPGTLESVQQAAVALARQPDGATRQYIPASDDVLFAAPLVNPNEHFDLSFTAPSTPGLYPFLCTFPGHSQVMLGVMEVIDQDI
ncbi:PVC-type heme-binding CxxCH protein [Parapedobacter deserti]|uniref:PVC-type heme-binding CxxCH protein n=1 Tax=Parapedobacter deserti TaxID=1912957 RepID=A0ABV7JIX4_9SPHI